MRLVIDTSSIISALIKNGISRRIIFSPAIQFITPDYTLNEISKYKELICKKAKIKSNEFDIIFNLIFEKITIIPKEEYKEFIKPAKTLIEDIDDVPFIALCLASKADGIWSDDTHFKTRKEITTTEEFSGLFNWAVEGLNRLLENGKFSYSKSTELIREEYIRKSNPVKAFVMDKLIEDSNSEITKEELYHRYKEYCEKNKIAIMPSNTFSIQIKRTLIHIQEGQRKSDGKRVWRGIRFGDADVYDEILGSGKKRLSAEDMDKLLGN